MVDLKGIEPSNLSDANRTLSQLSYRPIADSIISIIKIRFVKHRFLVPWQRQIPDPQRQPNEKKVSFPDVLRYDEYL